MIADLSLDDDDSKPPPGAAMLLREKVEPAELLVMCAQHRAGGRKEFAGAGVVLFLRDDEQTGEVVWDTPEDVAVNRRWIGTPYRHPKGTPLNGEFGR